MLKNLNNEDGISTIEFILTFSFALGAVFLFLKTAFMYTNGYLVHYANYQASRAYLVYESQTNDRNNSYEGSEVINATKKVFNGFKLQEIGINKGGGLQINLPQDVKYEYVGTWVEYEDQYSLTNIIGGKKPVTLRTESFLGKEPTRSECIARICNAFEEAAMGFTTCQEMGTGLKNMTFFDNGC